MREEYPLARLAQLIAAARAVPGPTRVTIRNTERFGLIHLYIQGGAAVRAHGHLRRMTESLQDLATWRFGTVRMEDTLSRDLPTAADEQLESALTNALVRLEAQSVIAPSQHPEPQPVTLQADQASTADATEQARPVYDAPRHARPTPPPPGTDGLPPLVAPSTSEPRTSQQSIHSGELVDRLTTPQWQMIALIVRQIMQKAADLVGESMAETMLRLSLTQATRTHPILHDIQMDASGWLEAVSPDAIAHYSTFDVADAIASLLTGFEARCASLIGPEQAQQIIASVAAPFRASLEQLGLHIAV